MGGGGVILNCGVIAVGNSLPVGSDLAKNDILC